jgi:hypothetical protein
MLEQNNIYCIKYKFQGYKVVDDFFINIQVKLKINFFYGLFTERLALSLFTQFQYFTSAFFFFKKIKNFNCFFAAPRINFEEVV